MNPRYQALLQLVDYPTKAEHLAVGDRVCVDGAWRKVLCVEWMETMACATYEGGSFYGTLYSITGPPGVPRIPGVLIQLLQPTSGDPYR